MPLYKGWKEIPITRKRVSDVARDAKVNIRKIAKMLLAIATDIDNLSSLQILLPYQRKRDIEKWDKIYL